MTCSELADILIDLVADEVSGPRKQAVDEHLDGCPPCFALFQTYQLTITLARRLPPRRLPSDLHVRLCQVASAFRSPPAGDQAC